MASDTGAATMRDLRTGDIICPWDQSGGIYGERNGIENTRELWDSRGATH
jgi:hypothetical protein